ncbi:MAG: hypothetical protein CL534_02895 [Ahrensia sp.]|nr:hypothetical protein [Ahrensia sp.]
MPSNGLTNTATRISGLLVLAIGLVHFILPTLGYAPDALAAIPEAQRAHFVYLGTYSIAFFLISFAVMTLMADRTAPNRAITLFLGLMVIVWGARFVLELVYPVDLSLFFVANPHPMLMATLLVIWIGYVVGLAGHLASGRHGFAGGSRPAV